MKQGGPIARKTPLKNTGTLARKSELSRGDGLKRAGELKRGEAMKRAAPAKRTAPAVPRKPARDTGITDAVRQVVKTRAGCRCERCNRDLAGGGGEVHHRRPRGMGGSRRQDTNQSGNLVLLCSGCHREAESKRAAARRAGWLVASRGNPMATPVLLFDGRWVLLHPVEARYVEVQEERVLPRSA